MYKSYSMELAGRTLTVDINRVAKQANGAALMHYGDTTVLSTATASKEPREGIDFFPLSVEYEEKMYAVGKIPGGFNKREGKASEHAILTSRVIDRPMRPLFPKDYRNDVTLVNMVMSVDPECNPEIPAMLGSSIATCISDIPFDGPCATTQVGLINGEYIINPTMAQKDVSDLQLTVASTREKVIMIEAGAKEVPEDKMIEAIYKAHEVNQEIIKFIDKIVEECGKPKHSYESCAVPEELFAAIKEIVPPEEMEVAVFSDDKQTREENIRQVTEKLKEAFADNEEWLAVLGEAVYQYQKKTVRKMILKDHKRPDGRAITQIRPLAAETDIIPRVHGSAMFTRGQTQICTITTLAPLADSCILDNCRNDLLGCHVHHGFRFDVNCFRINLILDLRSGLQLSLCKYSKFSEQFYSLICSKCRNGIYHRWQNRKSAAACLFFPFRSVAIAVKYDSLMLGSIFLDQIMDCQIKVFCALQNIAGFLKRLSSNGIQHHIACGNGILGTNHTKLEFIAGKSKG